MRFSSPNTLMAYGTCPQTSSFQGLSVYRYLVYSDDWSENPSNKGLAGILSSASLFNLASYPCRSWETLPVVYTGHSTFMLS